jgi:hypothetical protein
MSEEAPERHRDQILVKIAFIQVRSPTAPRRNRANAEDQDFQTCHNGKQGAILIKSLLLLT